MPRLRSDIWCGAFTRRHNDQGRICVITRRGDPVAGQIWIEVDHLNGKVSLYTPAPSSLLGGGEYQVFQRRFDHEDAAKVAERIAREAEFDPDLWTITLEMREGDPGLDLVET